MPKVNKQTYENIKELIDAEMSEVMYGDSSNTDRLANRILEKLGHEPPEEISFTDITPGEWYVAGENATSVRSTETHPITGRPVCFFGAMMPDKEVAANAELIAAAPRLAKAGSKMIRYVHYGVESNFKWPLGTKAIEDSGLPELQQALRDAGVDLPKKESANEKGCLD